VPWSRNSCHLDSLLEALHQALYPINFAALIAAEIADCSSPSEAWAWLLSKRAAGQLTAAIREQWWSVYVESISLGLTKHIWGQPLHLQSG
jgi:hypothetical protein